MTHPKEKQRTVTFLSREQLDFLDQLSKDALFFEGIRLSRAQILSELVDFLMRAGINVKDIDLSKEHLASGVLKIIRNNYNNEEKKDEQKALV